MAAPSPTPDGLAAGTSEDFVRPATSADLPRIADIWYAAQVEGEPAPPPLLDVPSLYRHELEGQELHVLERAGEVLAFGALVNRGSVAFLADLFVADAYRSSGVGRRLLHQLLPRDGRPCWTVSSGDLRALGLYARAGMRPLWPHLSLLTELSTLQPLPNTLDVIAANPDDRRLANWDSEISGRSRPADLAYWVHRRGGEPLWFVHNGEVVGYGVAQTRSDDLLAHPDAITLGPIGARTPEAAAACVYAAVQWAQPRAAVARIAITGPHPALPELLAAGFRIAAVDTFCATDGAPTVDPTRYVSSGGDLF